VRIIGFAEEEAATAAARSELRCGPSAADMGAWAAQLRWRNFFRALVGVPPGHVPLNHAALVDELCSLCTATRSLSTAPSTATRTRATRNDSPLQPTRASERRASHRERRGDNLIGVELARGRDDGRGPRWPPPRECRSPRG